VKEDLDHFLSQRWLLTFSLMCILSLLSKMNQPKFCTASIQTFNINNDEKRKEML
jgi:hypothetical protein